MSAGFRYDDLPAFEAFERVSDPSAYTPLPDDWMVGVSDVVRSTDALREGRYKDVNMAGAAVIGAVRNALGGVNFPFVFGGDGAEFAVPGEFAERTGDAMAKTAVFVAEELQLDLRVGMLSVSAIRAAGHEVRVARYAASLEAVYAMFSGGGVSYAEEELKAGRIEVPPAPPGTRPDLTGLSCRWSPIASRHGVILTLLVAPAANASEAAFRSVASSVIRITESDPRAGHPVPPRGPEFTLSPRAVRLEAAATRGTTSRLVRAAQIVTQMLIALYIDKRGTPAGGFDPKRYRGWVVSNSDYRKYNDALRMTIDCTLETAARLEALLTKAESDGIVDFGLHRQDAALMTCIVPSFMTDDHVHFLDGAGGGYALAASSLKEKLAGRKAAA